MKTPSEELAKYNALAEEISEAICRTFVATITEKLPAEHDHAAVYFNLMARVLMKFAAPLPEKKLQHELIDHIASEAKRLLKTSIRFSHH